jgi:hypothetical protein
MKYFFVLFLVLASSSCFAEEIDAVDLPQDRIKMKAEPDWQEAEKLMDRVSSHCNSGDFKEFMNCFTKKKASSIRKTMKATFASHQNVRMNIVLVDPISTEDDVAKFNLEYVWDADNVKQKSIIKSVVTAKKEGEFWRIDAEEVKDVTHVSKREEQPQQMNFGGGGQVVFNANDDFLPRDIVKRPGGCANGQCKIK